MRPDLIVFSASALVVGVMCLVLGAALNPAEAGGDVASAVGGATDQSGRWLAMAVLLFCGSVATACGMPAVLSLFRDHGRGLGTLGVSVLSVGTVGMSSLAMLLVVLQALATRGALRPAGLVTVLTDSGLGIVLWVGATGFYLGSLLVAAALLVSRATALWIPVLLVLFVLLVPLDGALGAVGKVVRLLALALAFTGIATAAVRRVGAPPSYAG